VDSFTKLKAILLKAAPELTDWRFHDMRRSLRARSAKLHI
jgi:hypothetical protein